MNPCSNFDFCHFNHFATLKEEFNYKNQVFCFSQQKLTLPLLFHFIHLPKFTSSVGFFDKRFTQSPFTLEANIFTIENKNVSFKLWNGLHFSPILQLVTNFFQKFKNQTIRLLRRIQMLKIVCKSSYLKHKLGTQMYIKKKTSNDSPFQ